MEEVDFGKRSIYVQYAGQASGTALVSKGSRCAREAAHPGRPEFCKPKLEPRSKAQPGLWFSETSCEEPSPLLGGASAAGAGVACRLVRRPTPAATGRHPSAGGDFRASRVCRGTHKDENDTAPRLNGGPRLTKLSISPKFGPER